jgi:DNA-binding Xre family transcriptional regulator
MLKYNLTHILKQKGITSPVGYFMKAGFRGSTSGRLSAGKFKNMKLNTLEKLCLLFECTPNDLLEWSPDEKLKVKENHPLMKLTRDYTRIPSLKDIGIDIPYDKLSLFAEKMIEVKKELLNQK